MNNHWKLLEQIVKSYQKKKEARIKNEQLYQLNDRNEATGNFIVFMRNVKLFLIYCLNTLKEFVG